MTETPDLIEALVARAQPVRRLRPPAVRACFWLALAVAVVAVIGAGQGMRPDLWEQAQYTAFLVCEAASLLTGVLAAAGCLLASLPDRSRWWLLLPAPALLVWFSTIGFGCLTDWIGMGPGGLPWGELMRCFSTLLLVSVPLSLALFTLLRHAARLRPAPVTMTAGLAVAAFAATALSLLHQIDASAMVLVWNLGIAAVIVAVQGAAGRRVLAWLSSAFAP